MQFTRGVANTFFGRSLPVSTVSRPSLRVLSRRFATEIPDELILDFRSPGASLFNNTKVKQVNVPGAEGIFALLPGHLPTIAELRPGLVTVIFKDETNQKFFVSGGFVNFTPDSKLSISSPEAVPLSHLDVAAAKQGLESWTNKLSSASSDEEKNTAAIAVEVHQAIINAIEKDI